VSGRKLRVVFLGHSAALSGAELGLVELVGAFDDVDPYVLLAEDGPLVDRLRAKGVRVEVSPLGERTRLLHRHEVGLRTARVVPAGLAAGAYSLRLARTLRGLRADLVHANTLKAFVYGCAAARLASLPLVWHVHDRIADDYMPGGAVRLVRAARRLASGVIANSEATLATLEPLPVPTAIVHEPVEQQPFGRRAERRGEPFTVAMVGRIAPWKGQDVFVRAFAAAFPDGRERALIIGAPLFGEDAFDESLRGLIEELGLEDRVDLCGFRDDVADELARVDALVHASVIPEPFGRVVVEGMAAGLPVIAAGAGGPTEIVTDGVDGLLHRPGDVAGLAAALERIAADPELGRTLGRAAAETARAYSPEAAARQTSDLYRRVLASQARRAA
jgi:glycosyltransferase involved in cell wall biosynthesis